jgi:hypothetical protein
MMLVLSQRDWLPRPRRTHHAPPLFHISISNFIPPPLGYDHPFYRMQLSPPQIRPVCFLGIRHLHLGMLCMAGAGSPLCIGARGSY